jgi:hypothetical protein
MPAAKTQYENLRENLNERYVELSDARLEKLMERNGMDAETMEGFFDQLGKIASSVGQTVLKAAPSILPVAGSVIGTAFGGPIGAQLGGSLGSLAGKAVGAATQGGSFSAGQLLQTMARPETLQALTSMAMGPLGKSAVAVGGTSVPVGAFGNLLKMLTGGMEAEYYQSMAASRESVPAYMQDYAGETKGDPAVAAHRAAALYELLDSSEAEESAEADAESAEHESYRREVEAWQAEYDAMELAEVYEAEEA